MTRIAIALIAAASLTGCAAFRPKPVPPVPDARCAPSPQWETTDTEGERSGVFVCFGEDGHLLYKVHRLPVLPTPEQIMDAKRAAARALLHAPAQP